MIINAIVCHKSSFVLFLKTCMCNVSSGVIFHTQIEWKSSQIIRGRFMVSHDIFLRFFFVIITKTRISMMSLKSTWVKRLAYLSPKSFSLNTFRFMINNQLRKEKTITEPTKTCSTNKSKGLLPFAVTLFFLTLNSFFGWQFLSFCDICLFWEWVCRSLHF